MCSLCDTENRWARHAGARCIKCSGTSEEEVVKILGPLCIIAALILGVHKFGIKPWYRHLRKVMTFSQIRKAVYKRQMKVKILLSFVQVFSRLQTTFRIQLPAAVKEFLSFCQVFEFFDVFSVILKAASCAHRTDYYTKVYVQTLGPLAVVGLLFLAFARTRKSYFFDLLLFVSFIVYPSSSATLIQFFDCYVAWPGVKGTKGIRFLLSDPSILCTDDRYIQLSIFYVLPMAAVFVVGFPVCYAVLIWRDRKFIRPKCPTLAVLSKLGSIQSNVIASEHALSLGLGEYLGLNLTKSELELVFSHWSRPPNDSISPALVKFDKILKLIDFGEQHEAWSQKNHQVSGPMPVLQGVPPEVHDEMRIHAIRAYTAANTRSKAEREKWTMHAREDDERAHRSAFLWKAYRPQYYWFEVFDMFRKVGLPC
jgi:hypothetical protein